ncbi:MAG: hypothetical protein BGO98_37580 [Myxococcales bacterium 68-20]|nr:MAG: hypothetical protein BGO98_37580 [Myxococcales bacterium 68-20]
MTSTTRTSSEASSIAERGRELLRGVSSTTWASSEASSIAERGGAVRALVTARDRSTSGYGTELRAWRSNANSAAKRSVFLDDLVWSIGVDRVKVQRNEAARRRRGGPVAQAVTPRGAAYPSGQPPS